MDGKYWDCSWNPLKVVMGYNDGRPILSGYHCVKVSPGCQHCWAEKYNGRFGNGGPYTRPVNPPMQYALDTKVLEKPLHWKKPRTIFVCDLCDLFLEDIGGYPLPEVRESGNAYDEKHFGIVWDILEIIEQCPQHTFLFLTKRPKRLREAQSYLHNGGEGWLFEGWPNVWWGLTVCNQAELDGKIEDFLSVKGNLWLSLEPLLGEIRLDRSPCGDIFSICEEHSDGVDLNCDACCGLNRIRQVIVGGESGAKARPMHPNWVRKIRDDCQAENVPFFFKNWGESVSVGMGKKEAGRLLEGREYNDLIWAAQDMKGESHG